MISKEELLKRIRDNQLTSVNDGEEVIETIEAPTLKPVKTQKDRIRVGNWKFYAWLEKTIKGDSTFRSNNRTKYKIVDPIEYEEGVPILWIKVIQDDNNPENIGKIMRLLPDEIVDLIGEEYF